MATKEASKPASKSEIIVKVSDLACVSKGSVKAVFDAFAEVVQNELKAANSCLVPGLMKIKKVYKPAVKGGKKAISPFTKEEYVTKDKPACNKIRVVALKALKDMA